MKNESKEHRNIYIYIYIYPRGRREREQNRNSHRATQNDVTSHRTQRTSNRFWRTVPQVSDLSVFDGGVFGHHGSDVQEGIRVSIPVKEAWETAFVGILWKMFHRITGRLSVSCPQVKLPSDGCLDSNSEV